MNSNNNTGPNIRPEGPMGRRHETIHTIAMIPHEVHKDISEVLRKLHINSQISIGVVRSGNPSFLGLINEPGGVQEIDNPAFSFEIGSVTKCFTGHLLAQLVLSNIAQLDCKINDLLPFDILGSPSITLAQLALHTSGLPRLPGNFERYDDYSNRDPYAGYTELMLQDYLTLELQLEFEPGTKFLYSNLGAGLLGYVLSVVNRMPFAALVLEKIFRPTGMMHSCFDVNDTTTPYIAGMDENGELCEYWDGGILNGNLGIISTAGDLLKFATLLLDAENPVVHLQTQVRFPVEPGFSSVLGFGERVNSSGYKIVGINGGTQGSAGSLMIDQVNQRAIVVLSNIHPVLYMKEIYPVLNAMMADGG